MSTQTNLAETNRLEAFSDGVFAIAITLLVLELHSPELEEGQRLWPALVNEWPQFAAYLTSFAILGIMWVNHHSMFRQIKRADRGLMFLNLLLLLWVTLLPFPTSMFAEHLEDDSINASVAAAVYSANLTLAAIAFSAIWWHVLRNHLVDHDMNKSQVRKSLIRYSFGTVIYAACIGVSFISAQVTLLIVFLLALYYGFEQIRTRGETG
ncbi:TMEM175 family protein [Kribbella kalugense]|uniref:TMEM175 family protein n=1 Tax=Kribbella kalugense TaxID=2512221 RepID=UPI001417100A|nr:TMEM175 family protein [Kribbella kalugense]